MQAKISQRQRQIMDQLHTTGEVRVAELRDALEVTEMTIRRDLEKLEGLGLAKRTFGGAILASKDITLGERTPVMAEEKNRIGRKAASLVQPGDSIFIDGGSTTIQIARHLPAHAQITVVTNAINVAAELAEKKIQTIVLGGILLDTTNSTIGPAAVEALSLMAFDKVFLGATGVNPDHGFSNSNMYEAEIKRLSIQKARNAYVVLDHSKFGERVLVSFAGLSDLSGIITDRLPELVLATALKEAGTSIILA